MFQKRIYLFLLFALLSIRSATFSQSFEPRHTFNIEVGLPNGFSNPAFKSVMQGLVSLAAYNQFDFKNHLTIGGGLRYSYYAVNEFKVTAPVNGGMHSPGAFLKFGWQKFHNDRFATDMAIRLGYSMHYFDTDQNDTLGVNPLKIGSLFLEPSLGLILMADEQNSFRFFISYALSNFGFKPSFLGLETLGGFDPGSLNKITSALIVGFGYTHYFTKR